MLAHKGLRLKRKSTARVIRLGVGPVSSMAARSPKEIVKNVTMLLRYAAGGLRRLVALAWRAFGRFPFFCYRLWTFEIVKVENGDEPVLTRQSLQTAPKG